MPRVLLIRHALSVWNLDSRWQGHADPPLAESGRGQAEAAARTLGPVDLVITSDLDRARHTGAILAPTAPIHPEPLLRELDVGEWSGHTRAEIQQVWPNELARFDSGEPYTPPGGERRDAFEARVRAGLNRVATTIEDTSATHTLVVGHAGVIRAIARLQGLPHHHIGHLCGFQGEVKEGEVALVHPVDLLDGWRPDDPVVSPQTL